MLPVFDPTGDRSSVTFAQRLGSLGYEPLGFALWVADSLVVLAVASALVTRFGDRSAGAIRTLLALGTVALSILTASGLALGFLGELGPLRFLSIHLALLGAVAARSGAGPWRSRARCLGRLIARPLGDVARGLARVAGPAASWPERLLSWAILGVLGLAVVLAALTPPLNGDTLAYRLPRITWWLQEGQLGHIAALDLSDARVNYTPFGPDLVMLWVVGFFSHGFPLIGLPQLVGGVLAAAGAYRLTFEVGLPRWAALAGVVLLLGMPNVCVQLLTAQTDLYTAGCATAFLVFLLTALKAERTMDWILAGTALGLAVGAKGTMFYWAPGLLLLLALAALLLRSRPAALLRGVIVAGLVAVPLGGPAYALNLRHYGNPFAPLAAIERVHVRPESSRLHFAAVNGLAYAWQLLLPSSNPRFVRPPTSLAFEAGAEQIRRLGEESPPFAGFVGNFDKNLASMRRYMWHEDNLSMGVLAAILALIGGLRVLASVLHRGRARGDLVAATLLASVTGFFVTFCLLHGWEPHNYRYFVLVAPVLAVIGARALAAPGRRPGAFARDLGVAVVAVQAFMAAWVPLTNPGNGLPSLHELPRITRLDRAEAHAVLEVVGPDPIALCLGPMNPTGPFGFFLRGPVRHRVSFAPLPWLRKAGNVRAFLDSSGCDALVLEPALCDVPLGDVAVSFASARRTTAVVEALPPGQKPEAVCLHSWGLGPTGWTRRRAMVQFDNWSRPLLPISLTNPTPIARTVSLSTSATKMTITLGPGESRDPLPLPVASTDRLNVHVAPLYRPPNRPGRALGIQLGLPYPLVCRDTPVP